MPRPFVSRWILEGYVVSHGGPWVWHDMLLTTSACLVLFFFLRTAFTMWAISKPSEVRPVTKQPMSPSKRSLAQFFTVSFFRRDNLVEVESWSVGVWAVSGTGYWSLVSRGVNGKFEAAGGKCKWLLTFLDIVLQVSHSLQAAIPNKTQPWHIPSHLSWWSEALRCQSALTCNRLLRYLLTCADAGSSDDALLICIHLITSDTETCSSSITKSTLTIVISHLQRKHRSLTCLTWTPKDTIQALRFFSLFNGIILVCSD